MRFITAPDSVEYVQDKGFRERLGAVSNRTYRLWGTAKLTLMVRFITALDSVEYVQDNGFRERIGAVPNRTYRPWRTAKLTLMVRFPKRTGPYGICLR